MVDYKKMISDFEKAGIEARWDVCPLCGCSDFRLLNEYSWDGVPIELYPICAKCGKNTSGINTAPYEIIDGMAVCDPRSLETEPHLGPLPTKDYPGKKGKKAKKETGC